MEIVRLPGEQRLCSWYWEREELLSGGQPGQQQGRRIPL